MQVIKCFRKNNFIYRYYRAAGTKKFVLPTEVEFHCQFFGYLRKNRIFIDIIVQLVLKSLFYLLR